MSPEQVRGEPVDGRSDLWSLGVVLYELITGSMPFSTEYERAALYSILNKDPAPMTSIRAGVPMSLDWMVAKLLAKNTNERYQSAAELMVDLKAADLRQAGLSRMSAVSTMSSPGVTADIIKTDGYLRSRHASTGIISMDCRRRHLLRNSVYSVDGSPTRR